MDFHTISLFSGVSMLDEGLRTGLEYLGIAHRTICHVEREAYACAVLAARMEEGSLDAAPIWTDVVTFDAHAWRGKVDCIVAGFPCQDISIAGRRAGLDGKRSGLFFEVVRIAEDCDARYIFLENVSAIASATATVVDQAEGELEERAAARVMGELADRGWDSEWITLSASDVGASHGRARWFCWAWRREVDNAAGSRCDGTRQRAATNGSSGERMFGEGCAPLAHAERAERGQIGIGGIGCVEGDDSRWDETNHRSGGADAALADAGCSNAWRGEHITGTGGSAAEHHPCGNDLAVADSPRWTQAGSGFEIDAGCEFEQGCGDMAHLCGTGREGRELGRTRIDHRGGQEAHGPTEQLCSLFAPGPSDPRWPDILAGNPWLRPALTEDQEREAESVFRGMADELADGLDFGSRAQRLKCIGNGVVPAQAAFAFVLLARRSGMT